jgi:site-specific recombinase
MGKLVGHIVAYVSLAFLVHFGAGHFMKVELDSTHMSPRLELGGLHSTGVYIWMHGSGLMTKHSPHKF